MATTSAHPAAIRVTDLRVDFGTRTVIDGLSLTVHPGEVFALLGPNGAGKTTMITILTTLVRPTSGTVEVAGIDVARDPVAVQQRISLTGQSAAVDDVLTATENLVMLGRLSGLSARTAQARAAELLAQFDLSAVARARVGTFSGGMRRRLDLALSLVVPTDVLFLDEPTTGLDTRSRRELWDAIRALSAAGTTIFLTTQYLEEADQLADRVAVLDGGRIVALGTPTHLKSTIGGETLELHDPHGDLIRSIPTDGTVVGLRTALDSLGADELAAVATLRRPTLDDVFLSLTSPDALRAAPALEESR